MEVYQIKDALGKAFYGREISDRSVRVLVGQQGYNYYLRMLKNFRLYHRLKRNYENKRKR